MIDLLNKTVSIIKSKLILFLFVAAQGVIILKLMSVACSSLIGFIYPSNINPFSQHTNSLDFSFIILLLLLLFLIIVFSILTSSYNNISILYVTMIKKEDYKFINQLNFVLKNILRITSSHVILFIFSIFLCSFISYVIYALTQNVSFVMFMTSYLVNTFLIGVVLLFCNTILLLEKISIFEGLKKSINFIKKNLFHSIRLVIPIILAHCAILLLIESHPIIFILSYFLINIFFNILITVFYIRYENNSVDNKNFA